MPISRENPDSEPTQAESFAIFAIKRQFVKISSSKNLLLTELRTPSTVCLSCRSSKSTEKLS